ncbi:MAG: UDP-N-acetylmuramoyl-L-alanyl-D-glutamate--2,6-diaminopimelate ligase [Patescibacteria group bacterium]|nr:UDP-N-acetylmuramoyl-L-alanyl-D-glutamate--2,6-diaminopimelate ligase [Patescibacteria group bacterium]
MLQKIRKIIPNFIVNSFWHLPKAILANFYYGFPSKNLTIIGITGTSGKTSTAHLTYHLLLKSDFKVALISTISAKLGKKEIGIGLHVTNPDPFSLQKLLKNIYKKGFTHVILEVTSHGLVQHRCWGIKFDYGLITNITHEHLDYHKTLANYKKAKLKLLKMSKNKINFKDSKDFNIANQNAASSLAKAVGINQNMINKAIKTFKTIPGRMETVYQKDFTIIIDFAHKPDALEKALFMIRKNHKKGRIISVFGCAGLRDTLKRPMMGKIASQLSDITILTAEDPRTETVKDINDQIKSGFIKKKINYLYRQKDRQKAINLAVELAKPGDIVALFGKSHEKSMCFGTIEHPWSEHQAVKTALKLKSKN